MVAKEEKKKVINRLKTMYPLRAKVNEVYQKSVEAVKAGKPTVWAMVNHWEADPIFKTMDLEIAFPNITKEELACISDTELERIASKMADDYCQQLYWSSLAIIAGDVLGRDDYVIQ